MKLILFAFLNFFGLISFAQTKDSTCHCVTNNIFYTSITNGANQKIPISFEISEEAMQIMKKGSFVLDSTSLVSQPRFVWNKKSNKYVKDSTMVSSDSIIIDNLVHAIDVKIYWGVADLKLFKIKHPASFTIPQNSTGKIYVNMQHELTIVFQFECQNDLGGMIKGTCVIDKSGTNIID